MNFLMLMTFIFLSACQLKPTKVSNEETGQKPVVKGAEILQQNPVLLDVRPAFEFNLAHAPGAINVRWEDFSQQSPQSRGVPLADRTAMARRLALIGVDLQTPVVVLGKVHSGQGEEGRVAWTLKLLGVQQVQTLNANLIKDRSVVRDIPLVKNKPYWTVDEKAFENLMISLGDFKKALADSSVTILDARLPDEVKLHSLAQSQHLKAAFRALPWKKFFTEQGLVDESVLGSLKEIGVTSDSKLVVISNHGVRSGAVVYALQQLGWKNVRNYAGGYEQFGYK